MARLPELNVRIGARSEGVGRGVADAKKGIKGIGDEMASQAARAAKFGAALAGAFATIKAAALAAGIAAAKTATDIANMARVANTTPEAFQKWAAGARTVGVEQEKLSDILKDVNDRVGEFLATGSGPMKDFFDNIAPRVGVTAEEFARLSGPEALQLYVDSLEKAGLSQQQMTFYLEAMSGDLTKLLPLLKNGGTEMRKIGDEAERSGRIISNDMIRSGEEMDRLFKDISDTLRTSATKAVLEHKDEIMALATFISDKAIPAVFSLLEAASSFAEGLQPAIDKWVELGKAIATALGLTEGPAASTPADAPHPDDLAFFEGQREASTTGTYLLDPITLDPILPDGNPFSKLAPTTSPRAPSRPDRQGRVGGRGGGGGSRGPSMSDLEALQERFMTEQELLDEHLAAMLEKLEEFREARLAGEEELAELEQRIRGEHLDEMTRLEREALDARLQMVGSALGDLGALMTSENRKLFNIGKAARLAEATIDGYRAAVAAWEKGMSAGGPPVAAAFTAASLARTGALISQIASTSVSGGGGGQGRAAGGSAAGAAAAPPMQTFRFTLTNDQFGIGQNLVRQLVQQINEASRNGAQIRATMG